MTDHQSLSEFQTIADNFKKDVIGIQMIGHSIAQNKHCSLEYQLRISESFFSIPGDRSNEEG